MVDPVADSKAVADSKNGKKTVYVMIPRKLMYALITIGIILFVGVLGSYQYANYVARQLCGIINIQNDAFKTNPPQSGTGKTLAREFQQLSRKYHC